MRFTGLVAGNEEFQTESAISAYSRTAVVVGCWSEVWQMANVG